MQVQDTTAMSGNRPNCPATMRDARSVRAGIILGIIDLLMLAIMFLWLIFVCGGGTWPGTADPDTRLGLFHLAHLALAFPAILLFALSVLFLPIWFAIFGLIVFFIDIFVLVGRFNILAAGGFSLFCTLFLLLFDIVFLILAVLYMGFAVSAITRFGLFGDASAVRTPYTVPRFDATGGSTPPQPKAMPVATPSGSALRQRADVAAATGIPSVYIDSVNVEKERVSF